MPVKFRLALGRRDKGFLLKTVLGSKLEGMVKRRIAVFCRANRSESHPDCDTTWHDHVMQGHAETQMTDELKQLRISMNNFTDLLRNSQPVGPCVRKMAADRPVVFCAAHIWPLITLGLFALFLFPEKRRPQGSGPTALQHVQARLQHHCKCHTMLARSLEGGLRW